MKISHLAVGFAFLSLASTASATTFVVTDVEFPNLVTFHIKGTLPGGPSYDYDQGGGPIFLTGKVNGLGNAETLFVYCDDIPHHIFGGAGQHIVYDIGPIHQNNAGDDPATNPVLSTQVIDNISGLAKLGYQDYIHGDNVGAGVAQGAIWVEEYGITQSYYSDPTLEGLLLADLQMNFGPPSLPQLLNINADGRIDVQGQIPGNLGVPEPAAWATMLLGCFGLGGMLRRRRAAAA